MTNSIVLSFERLMNFVALGRNAEIRDLPAQAPGFSEPAVRDLGKLNEWPSPFNFSINSALMLPSRQAPRLPRKVLGHGKISLNDEISRIPDYSEHRNGLRSRFLAGGNKSILEYELLELLLLNAIKQCDVKPLAKNLLATFGDLNGVIAASEHRLLKVDGATKRVYLEIRLAQAFAQRMGQAKILQREVVTSWDDVISYCRISMAHLEIEQFRLLFLDQENVIIADEEQAKGTVDHVPVYPREVAKRALELNASAIIMVHNHPSGDPTPSQEDISMTKAVSMACECIGVSIHDHVIIGKGREYSFQSGGIF